MSEIISAVPDPSLFAALRNMGYTPETAVADLIDNSISACSREINIEFKWDENDPNNSFISITDDGDGMNKDTLVESMRLASFYFNISRKADDLGRFGLGLKTAGMSLGKRLTVITNDGQEIVDACWDMDKICYSTEKEWNIYVNCERELIRQYRNILETQTHGTVVLIEHLDSFITSSDVKKLKDYFYRKVGNIANYISLIFHRFIEEDKITIKINNTIVEPWNPFLATESTAVYKAVEELDEEILPSKYGDVIVQPYILPHKSKFDSEDSYKRAGGYNKAGGVSGGWKRYQGIYLYRNRRLICYGTWFDILHKEDAYNLARIQIDITSNHDEEWKITVDKSKAEIPLSIKDRVSKIIERSISRSTAIYNSRASPSRGKSSVTLAATWEQLKAANGKYEYKLNKKHPLYQKLRTSLSNDQKDLFMSYIALVENFSPVMVMGLEHYDGASPKTLSNPETERDIQKITEIIKGLKSGGFDPEEIKQTVLDMPKYRYLINDYDSIFGDEIND